MTRDDEKVWHDASSVGSPFERRRRSSQGAESIEDASRALASCIFNAFFEATATPTPFERRPH
jgi:hypothetical protein